VKTKIIIILLVLSPVFIFGQGKKKGVSFGLNIAKWSGDTDGFTKSLADEMNQAEGFSGFYFINKPRFCFSMGYLIDYQINKSFSIQPEIWFIQKGIKFTGSGRVTVSNGYETQSFNVDETMTMQTDYAELSVFARYSITDSKVIPYLYCGPNFGYLIISKMKVKVAIDGDSDTESEKYSGFEDLDVGLSVGGGLDFSKKLRIDVRYQYGFTPVVNENSDDGFKMHNSVFIINLVTIF